jgi:hypothetical protein
VANFAERIAYWYLRLNGFFPLTNFVLHRDGSSPISDTNMSTGDTDIIAVRLPYTDEVVGGADGVDRAVFRRNGIRIADRICAVICEIKGGSTVDVTNLMSIRSRHRLLYAVKRIGVFDENLIEVVVTSLLNNGEWMNESYYICTRLVMDTMHVEAAQRSRIKYITLQKMDRFNIKRVASNPEKLSDWNFFNDDYIQYLIWRATRRN